MEARDEYGAVGPGRMPMAQVARAPEMDESRGMMKAVIDGETGETLGCAILGIEGAGSWR